MKRFLLIPIFLFCIFKINAQKSDGWLVIRIAATHPVFNFGSNYEREYNINPEIEILSKFKIFKTSKLATGLGLQSGKYNSIEDVSELVWVEGTGWLPTEYNNNWKLEFVSLYVPVIIMSPVNNFVLDSYTAGIDIGAIINHNISLKDSPDVPNEKINRYFLDWNFSIEKLILHSKSLNIGISPYGGIRTYLTKNNAWQKNHLFYGFKLNFSL